MARSPNGRAEPGLADQLGGLNMIQARLQQRRLHGHPGAARRLGIRPCASRCCATTATAPSPMSRARAVSGTATSSTQTAAWADIDNDGFLDLFAGSENGPSQLFRNKGNGTFEDISQPAGVDRSVVHQRRRGGRLRQRRIRRLLRVQLQRRQPALSQQPQSHVHRSRASRPACRRRGAALPPGSSTTTTTAGPTSS